LFVVAARVVHRNLSMTTVRRVELLEVKALVRIVQIARQRRAHGA
jgi:hypothetical protein